MIKTHSNLIIIILSLSFWTTIFLLTPYEILRKEKSQEIKLSIDKERENNTLEPESVEKYIDSHDKFNKQSYYGISVLVYSFLIFFIFFDVKVSNKVIDSFITKPFLSLVILLIAAVYYSKTKDSFVKINQDYIFYFFMLNALPILVILYAIFRIIIKRLLNTEPIFIVGDMAFFSDPLNWLFRTMILLIGILVSIWINLIEEINKLIMHSA